jgi:hypothetical protein
LGPAGLAKRDFPKAEEVLAQVCGFRPMEAKALLRMLVTVKLYSFDVMVGDRGAEQEVRKLNQAGIEAELVQEEDSTEAESEDATWSSWNEDCTRSRRRTPEGRPQRH